MTSATPSTTPSLLGSYSSNFVRLLFDYVSAQGLNAQRVLGEAPPSPGDRGLERYTAVRWRGLMERAASVLRDPLLGLHLGRTITPAHLGVPGYVLLACRDAGAALLRWQQYEGLIADVARMDMRTEGASFVLEWHDALVPLGPLVDEAGMTTVVQFSRNITGTAHSPEEVHFVHPAPENLRPYRDYFGCTVRFEQPSSLIRFRTSLLSLPLRQPDATLLDMMEHRAKALLAELSGLDDFERTVRRSIAHLARAGEISMERTASEMNLTSRTLHRRLTDLGCNFRSLRNDTRRRLAMDYLSDPRLTLGEIAWLLGYSELSAFTRAFGGWTGQSPSGYRRDHPAEGG